MERTQLRYGHGRHKEFDPAKHRMAWGARLIYDEVVQGFTGIVWDRTDAISPEGEPERFSDAPTAFTTMVEHALQQWLELIRREHTAGRLTMDSDKTYGLWYESVYTVGGPQGSHGYIYVTQKVYKPEAMPWAPRVVEVS